MSHPKYALAREKIGHNGQSPIRLKIYKIFLVAFGSNLKSETEFERMRFKNLII